MNTVDMATRIQQARIDWIIYTYVDPFLHALGVGVVVAALAYWYYHGRPE